jgi:hypothetical protein
MPAMPKLDDSAEARARARLLAFFFDNPSKVFFSRQLEVLFEREFFHWITNRALRRLIEQGLVATEARPMTTGSEVKLVWNKKFRFYKRAAEATFDLVNRYSTAATDGTLGMQGEHLVLAAFARRQYLLIGEETSAHRDVKWTETGHDLDFIFEKNGIGYGVEVKNMLGYMEVKEFVLKTKMALHLGLRPVFAVRAMPETWISALAKVGGFALVMGYQFYPWTHKDLATEIRKQLSLPVDSPRRVEAGTMDRFERYFENPKVELPSNIAKVSRILDDLVPPPKTRELPDEFT